MDGENHGKPYEQMDALGGKKPYFWKHPYIYLDAMDFWDGLFSKAMLVSGSVFLSHSVSQIMICSSCSLNQSLAPLNIVFIVFIFHCGTGMHPRYVTFCNSSRFGRSLLFSPKALIETAKTKELSLILPRQRLELNSENCFWSFVLHVHVLHRNWLAHKGTGTEKVLSCFFFVGLNTLRLLT